LNKILLIEDDTALSKNIREALTDEQFLVEIAYDGLIAEKILKKTDFDCIILDINLPGKNGYAICSDYRKYNTSTPILMLTAFDELEDKVQGFKSGADDYLTKPFYMRELILRVHSLLKRKNKGSNLNNNNSTLLAGDIIINTNTQKVTRQEIEIILTPREYQILVILISAQGELVPKKDLIKEIWGTTFDANTNTIEVYINFLRKKIDKPFGKDSIKTKIGFGYYFDER
jgi:DNA-binding response OmpR family regulator